MLSFVYTLAVLLASCLLTSAAPLKTQHEYYPWNPVMFNSFPKHINADSEITLSWKGGSGKGYEVYYVPQFDGPGAYQSVDIATTTQHSIKWKTPHKGSYPADTSFVIAVRDLTEGSGAVWYDLTGRVPFVQSSARIS